MTLALLLAALASGQVSVKLHKDAGKWEPYSVRVSSSAPAPASGRTVVRKYPSGEDALIVVSVFPRDHARSGRHYEVRFLVQEGWLEELKVAKITSASGVQEDSIILRKKGLEFQEELPASAQVRLTAFQLKKGGLHAGSVKKSPLGDFSWSGKLQLPAKMAGK